MRRRRVCAGKPTQYVQTVQDEQEDTHHVKHVVVLLAHELLLVGPGRYRSSRHKCCSTS